MIPFWKIIPGGNPTVLLRMQDIAPEKRAAAANALMSPFSVHAEQAGFVDFGTRSLAMMGGEFCVNAVRAFAVLLEEKGLLQKNAGGFSGGSIRCSGAEHPVDVQVRRLNGSMFLSRACLRFPELPAIREMDGGARLVAIPGIAHIIESGSFPHDPDAFCAAQRERNALGGEEAVGHLWLAPGSAPDHDFALKPVIWVRDTGTLCRETACGSGSLAAALHMRSLHGGSAFRILQPSGYVLEVSFEPCGGAWKAWIGGMVWTATQGMAALPEEAAPSAHGDFARQTP